MLRRLLQCTRTGGAGDEDVMLRSASSEVTEFDESLLDLVIDLIDTAERYPFCVGLAAPQIGVSKRVTVVKTGKGLTPMINPVLVSATGKKDKKRESCMSVWGLCAPVERREKVEVRYQTTAGTEVVERYQGYEARIIQHEVDHLNGLLYIDRADRSDIVSTDLFDGYTPDAVARGGTEVDA